MGVQSEKGRLSAAEDLKNIRQEVTKPMKISGKNET